MEEQKKFKGKKKYLNEEVDKIIIDESFIEGILWKNEGKHLEVIIDWCGQDDLGYDFDWDSITTKLEFSWITDLEMNFKFNKTSICAIEISEFRFEKKDKVWEVIFDCFFEPKGIIRFSCNDFKFVIEEKS